MALASANRSWHNALDIKFRHYTPDGVIEFGPSKGILLMKVWGRDTLSCTHSSDLWKCTANLRLKESSKNHLFISFRKPHKAVCSLSIARWMKSVLASTGVDTDQFKAHSTRAAAASAAKAPGVSLKDIMSMADWSHESSFIRFYHKPVVQSDFGRAVLSRHTSPWWERYLLL